MVVPSAKPVRVCDVDGVGVAAVEQREQVGMLQVRRDLNLGEKPRDAVML